MKFKLDENIGTRGRQLFVNAGYDVATVVEQNLAGVNDDHLIDVCREEKRCLVTLDLDFSNPLHYQPSKYAGIAVLRLPKQSNYQDLLDAISTLIEALKSEALTGKLWIVQRGSIRIYQEDD
jgi:predicted nuclease of predicted toxin-antitoxin system